MKKGTPEQFDQIPVGTGSFQFVDYQKDAVIRFKAFDGWAGKPKIDDLDLCHHARCDGPLCQAQGQ